MEEKESRQVLRRRAIESKKKGNSLVTHQVYHIPIKTKSRSGVEYINYKKVVDLKGLNKK